jgi:hypothetical protein
MIVSVPNTNRCDLQIMFVMNLYKLSFKLEKNMV